MRGHQERTRRGLRTCTRCTRSACAQRDRFHAQSGPCNRVRGVTRWPADRTATRQLARVAQAQDAALSATEGRRSVSRQPSLEKRWLKIHQDAEATTNFEENLAFWTPVIRFSRPCPRPGARTRPRAFRHERRRYRGRTAARRRCILFYFFWIFGRARTRALPRGRLTRYQGRRK